MVIMKKGIVKTLFTIFIAFIFMSNVFAVSSNTSLKDLKDKLAKDKAALNSVVAKQNKVKNNIKKIEGDLTDIAEEINQAEKDIKESKEKVEELKLEIESKQKEIDGLLSFNQVADGENVYLEYIFKAKSFTDFIYRNAIVEQLTKYNDETIDEMYELIDENKKEQERLNQEIDKSENTVVKLNATLKKYNLSMEDLVDDHKDAKADYTASKKEVEAYQKLYKKYGCKETDPIIDCISVPYADGFTRPVKSGSISSEYGLRYHPTLHYYRMHIGVDIAVPTNTPVYASAAGIVSKIVRVSNPNKANSSCGGNMVYVKHRVNGKEYTTVYMHLHSISVKLNEYLTLSSVVGKSGGGEKYDYCTTGPHLHFGIMKGNDYVNPRNYIKFPSKGVKFTSRF